MKQQNYCLLLSKTRLLPLEDKKAPLRYYSGKCGPGFLCGANNKLPYAWGAVKVMLAFSKLPLVDVFIIPAIEVKKYLTEACIL